MPIVVLPKAEVIFYSGRTPDHHIYLSQWLPQAGGEGQVLLQMHRQWLLF